MKKQLLLIVMMLLPMVASADAVEIDGIFYNLVTKVQQAEVTSNPNKYSGNIIIPSSITYENVKYDVISIQDRAFYWCQSLTSIIIGNKVKTIGREAFGSCSSLTDVTISNSVLSIKEAAFSNCNRLTTLKISDLESWCNISFGDYDANPLMCAHRLFLNDEEITDLSIPNSVTSIGNFAFVGFTSMKSLSIPNSVTSIGKRAFMQCTAINSVSVPNSVMSLGEYAFQGCSSLNSISFSNNLTEISEGACNYCTSLSTITIPNNITDIGNYAFEKCDALISIIIPNGVININGCAFRNCSNLTSVTIPNSVTCIGGGAFSGCSSLTSFTIPNSVTSIGVEAFRNCTGLTSFTIPNGVSNIGEGAFNGCTGLSTITISNSVSILKKSMFENCMNLATVEVPNTLKKIENRVFAGCKALSDITFPNTLEYIGAEAFIGCSSLSSLIIPPNVVTIGYSAFSNCSSLLAASIPDGVRSIGSSLFKGCSKLTTLTLGKNITNISYSAFANCKELVDVYCYAVNVPDTKSDAFLDSYIDYATLHVPVTSIDTYKATKPWSDFKNIIKIDIPLHTLTYIVDDETYKTYEIEEGESITPEPVPTKEGYIFSGWSNIPETMPDHDVTVTGSFAINKYKLTYMVNGEVYKSYDVEYEAKITPEPDPTKEGYTFSGWSKIPETMPAHDVTITGTFTANKYLLIYRVDGFEYKKYEMEYGAPITPEAEPEAEGFTFSGWSEIPETMPAHDVTVTGSFVINQYTITYIIDNEVYMTEKVDYGSTITPPTPPSREGYDFAWGDYPETMPAYDITIYGTYTTGVNVIWTGENSNVKIYSIDGKQLEKPQKGLNIIRMSDGTTKKVVVK